MEETKVLKRLRKGETKALEEVIEEYSNYVQAVVTNIIGISMSVEDIEEVVSDVFFALWNQKDKVHPGKLKQYLSSIARNQAINKLRELKINVQLEGDELFLVSEKDDTEQKILKKEQRKIIYKALKTLEESDREIFIRHYYYYQTVEKISEEMELNPSTIKSRLRRGREKLKNILQKEGYSEEYGCEILKIKEQI